MKRTLMSLILCSLVAVAAFAQAGPSKPADTPTADQILDKYVQGLGGKAALEKFNSTASKGTFEIPAFGATGSAEMWEKERRPELVKLFKERFRTVKPMKPKASRDKSSETFLVGIGLKGR